MNRLQYETSPYLLQHAHNPVDWYAWKPEAFEKAKAENKPILVSIGYSTCHWCHVMERESFEDERVAAFMNEYFINIKVDREERPDVDSIYMEACQYINGGGCGWPLNCFLTSDGRPFYAGTYFPPQAAYNRPSWSELLERIAYNFFEKPETVEQQAKQLMDLIAGADNDLLSVVDQELFPARVFTKKLLQNIFQQLERRFDTADGGFGGAPKFPSSMSLQYLLDYYYFTNEQKALEQLELSLDRMIQGGIYDQLGGGFARYATDKAWLVPHFEKMLYDNALLIVLLSETYKLTQKTLYKETIVETLDYIAREMTSAEGGFYAAQDADSEGVEGKFYVWQKAEIEAVLSKEEATLFNDFYGVSADGNWEHTNILWQSESFEAYASEKEMDVTLLKEQLAIAKAKLFKVRDQRVYPGLDDKILLDWNALLCKAHCAAYHALGDDRYKAIAKRNIEFLLTKFSKGAGLDLYHTYKNGQAQYDAFLSDYAFLIDALFAVYEVTFDLKYLDLATRYCDFVIQQFLDKPNKMFYFTSTKQNDIVLRKKELYDSAVPSGNSTMALNLQRIGILMDRADFRQLAVEMLVRMKDSIERYPSSFGRWSKALLNEVYGIPEIVILGTANDSKAKAVQSEFLPDKVLMATATENENYPLLAGKILTEETMIYLCKDYVCQRPVEEVSQLFENLAILREN